MDALVESILESMLEGADRDQIDLANDGTVENGGEVEALMSGRVLDVAVDQLVIDPAATLSARVQVDARSITDLQWCRCEAIVEPSDA